MRKPVATIKRFFNNNQQHHRIIGFHRLVFLDRPKDDGAVLYKIFKVRSKGNKEIFHRIIGKI